MLEDIAHGAEVDAGTHMPQRAAAKAACRSGRAHRQVRSGMMERAQQPRLQPGIKSPQAVHRPAHTDLGGVTWQTRVHKAAAASQTRGRIDIQGPTWLHATARVRCAPSGSRLPSAPSREIAAAAWSVGQSAAVGLASQVPLWGFHGHRGLTRKEGVMDMMRSSRTQAQAVA